MKLPPTLEGRDHFHGYPKPAWAVGQLQREVTGLVEDICEHGMGHPNRAWLDHNDPEDKRKLGVHGCDGCCIKR